MTEDYRCVMSRGWQLFFRKNAPAPAELARSIAAAYPGATVRKSRDDIGSDPIELPIGGLMVCSIAISRFEPFLVIRFCTGSAGSTDYSLAIDGPFVMTTPAGSSCLDPHDGPFPAYLDFATKSAASAVATPDGGLALTFTDGVQLTIAPYEYEPWQLAGEDGSLVVSVAGGGLSVWDADGPTGS